MKEFFISTTDNPYNPLTHWDEWWSYDREKGYNTSEYAARLVDQSPAFSEDLNDDMLMQTFIDMIKFDLVGKVTEGKVHYKIVVEE